MRKEFLIYTIMMITLCYFGQGAPVEDAHGVAMGNSDSNLAHTWGFNIITNNAITLQTVTKLTADTPTKAYLYDTGHTLLASSSFIGDDATFNYDLADATEYIIVVNAEGGQYTRHYSAPGLLPVSGTNFDYHIGHYNTGSWGEHNYAMVIESITTEVIGNAFFLVTAKDYFNTSSIMEFNATVNGTFYSTTNGTIVPGFLEGDSLFNITIQAPHYYNSPTYEASGLLSFTGNLTPSMEIYATEVLTGDSISDFEATVYNSTASFSFSSDGETLFIDEEITGSYTINVSASGNFASSSEDITVTGHTNETVSLWKFNSFYLTFRDEESREILDNTTVSLSVISDIFANNHTTTNGTLYIDPYVPASYELRYDAPGYDKRSYFVTVENDTAHNITLYLLDENNSSLIFLYITDQNGDEVEGVYAKATRRYIQNEVSSYDIVEMSKSNFYGQAGLNMVMDTVYYRFLIEGSDGTVYKYTDPTLVYDTSLYVNINTEEDVLTSWRMIDDVATNVYYDEPNTRFVFVWSDTQGLVDFGCLNVTRRSAFGDTVVCATCMTSASATLYCPIDANVTGTYLSTATIETNTVNSDYLVGVEEKIIRAVNVLGAEGLFWSMLLMAGTSMVAIWSPVVAVLLAVMTFVVSAWFGFLTVSYSTIVTLVIIGLITMYLMRK